MNRRTMLQATAGGLVGGAVLLTSVRPALAQGSPAAPAPAGAAPATYVTPGTPQPLAAEGMAWRNWSGLYGSTPRQMARPQSVDELAELVPTSSGVVRAVGSGHSFMPLVPTDDTIVSLDNFGGVIQTEAATHTATIGVGSSLGFLNRKLDDHGLGFRNLPDIDVQTFAGAIATATHGTGRELPALHADVTGLQMVNGRGQVLEISADSQPDLLAAARVSLGSLGIITQARVQLVPAYNLHRRVWVQPVDELLEQAPELAAKHRNFEMYYLPHTGYAAGIVNDIYTGPVAEMPPSPDDEVLADLMKLRDWLGWFPALRRWVAGRVLKDVQAEDARNRSWKLLSTVRPMRFNESEYHVPQETGLACLREVIAQLEQRSEVFFPIEFRYVAADDAWLSPFYQRPSCSIAIHAHAGEAYDYLLAEAGPIFVRHAGRPHWGKLNTRTATDLAALYPRWSDFAQIRQEMDPHGRFLNPYLRQLFA